MCSLVQKLKNCQKDLLVWSKKEMGRDRFRLKALQEHLKRIQAEPFLQHRFESEKVLLAEIETLMLREEMFLHQRSRVNWLSFGDTAFFHASINQRRQKNQ